MKEFNVASINYHPAIGNRILQWRHNEHDGVSNHYPHGCLLNSLYRRRSKKTSNLRVTGLCEGSSPVTGEFPAQRVVTRKMLPFDDVIMDTLPCSQLIWRPGTVDLIYRCPIFKWLVLKHWGRDKIVVNFLTTFSNALSWMKIYKFRLRFHLRLFPRAQLTMFQHWFR